MRDQSGSGWKSGVLTFFIALITFGVAWWFTRRETGTVPRWDPGRDLATPEPSPTDATVVPGPHGPGSAEPLADGSTPEGFPIKGNARSMLYHSPESPNYARTRAQVCFRTAEAAEAAGFRHWNNRRRKQ